MCNNILAIINIAVLNIEIQDIIFIMNVILQQSILSLYSHTETIPTDKKMIQILVLIASINLAVKIEGKSLANS